MTRRILSDSARHPRATSLLAGAVHTTSDSAIVAPDLGAGKLAKRYQPFSTCRSPDDVAAWPIVCYLCKCSGHATRDRHERFCERDHLDELGD
jgi:hypothetical protein